MHDAGCWMLDAICCMLDSGCGVFKEGAICLHMLWLE